MERQRWEESERRREEERRSEKRKSEKKEDAGARKGRKVAKHCVYPMFWGSGGSKSRLAKACALYILTLKCASRRTCSSEMLGGQGAAFPVRSSGLLRWFCVTGAALRSPGITFSWQAQYFRQMQWKNRKRTGRRPSALRSAFHFWRKSRRIACFWCCQL